jgi:hypothetical protein
MGVDMAHRTAPPAAAAEHDQTPLDITTMRTAVHRLLAEHADMPGAEELETLTLQLRGHIQLLIPEVEAAALRLPKDNIPRACALACIGESRMKLRLGAGNNNSVRMAVAVKLARSVNALCDHYENLSTSQK